MDRKYNQAKNVDISMSKLSIFTIIALIVAC